MKTRILLVAAVLFLTIAPFSSLAADEATILAGEFNWTSQGVKGPIEARFKATGEDTWAVSFYFDWQGKPKVWEGTAEGSLIDGPLQGEVFNSYKRRKFVFEGQVTGGEFSGTHAELDDGKPFDTGTIKLKRQS